MDSSTVPGEWKRKERDRDTWDQQLDRGKVSAMVGVRAWFGVL